MSFANVVTGSACRSARVSGETSRLRSGDREQRNADPTAVAVCRPRRLQVYRVLGGTFLVYWALGTMPGLFALAAGIGDVTTGLLALPAALAWRRRGVAWNLLGMTDLAVAITMGALTTTVFHSNTLIGTFPTVMIPAFMVPTSIILHGLSLWQLRRLQQTAERPRGAIQGTLVGAKSVRRPIAKFAAVRTVENASQNSLTA